jgi:Fe-S cluster assembly iron-binding protein IscA
MAIPYLKGSKIDYVNLGVAGSEIIIDSPQATSKCGCGVSVTFEV